MRTREETFERDRKEFLWRLDALLTRLRAADEDPPRAPPIAGLIFDIYFLELPARCGFEHPPLHLREIEDDNKVCSAFELFDPFDKSWFKWVSRDTGVVRDDQLGNRELAARRKLIPGIEAWKTAVESVPVRDSITATSGRTVDAKSRLDYLWRHLETGVEAFGCGHVPYLFEWCDAGDLIAYIRKVNALARYDGLTTGEIFPASHSYASDCGDACIMIRDPDDDRVTIIRYQGGYSPSKQDCIVICDVLGKWLLLRAAQLTPLDDSPRSEGHTREAGRAAPLQGEPRKRTLFEFLVAEGESARFMELKPWIRSALTGFQLACESNQALDRDLPEVGHHLFLRKQVDRLGFTLTPKAETWKRYVRAGKKSLFGISGRGHMRTRSIDSVRSVEVRRGSGS